MPFDNKWMNSLKIPPNIILWWSTGGWKSPALSIILEELRKSTKTPEIELIK
jgi:hypothetical protein